MKVQQNGECSVALSPVTIDDNAVDGNRSGQGTVKRKRRGKKRGALAGPRVVFAVPRPPTEFGDSTDSSVSEIDDGLGADGQAAAAHGENAGSDSASRAESCGSYIEEPVARSPVDVVPSAVTLSVDSSRVTAPAVALKKRKRGAHKSSCVTSGAAAHVGTDVDGSLAGPPSGFDETAWDMVCFGPAAPAPPAQAQNAGGNPQPPVKLRTCGKWTIPVTSAPVPLPVMAFAHIRRGKST